MGDRTSASLVSDEWLANISHHEKKGAIDGRISIETGSARTFC